MPVVLPDLETMLIWRAADAAAGPGDAYGTWPPHAQAPKCEVEPAVAFPTPGAERILAGPCERERCEAGQLPRTSKT